MRKVPDALEAREHRALEKRHRLDAVRDWNQGIPIAPEDRDGRQRGDLVRVVEEMPMLPPSVDHVADAAGERARGSGRRVELRQDGDFLVRERATGGAKRARRPERHEGLAETDRKSV